MVAIPCAGRFGFARVFSLKFLFLFIIGCFVLSAGLRRLHLSFAQPGVLGAVQIPARRLPHVDGRFFYFYSIVQGALAYLLTAFVGPVLVTPDFANGACRSISAGHFRAPNMSPGRMSVLLILLSLITWVPGVVLFAIQSSIEGWDWTQANFWLAGSIVLGLLVWIVVLSLIGLALSAWVKWKIGAGALVLGVIFAGAGFGTAINSLMRTNYGALIDLTQVAQRFGLICSVTTRHRNVLTRCVDCLSC